MATTPSDHAGAAETLTTGLGYYSLGLGAALLAAPGRLNHLIGVRDDPRSRLWTRFVGVQELSAAAGILAQRRPVEWLWGRTAADVLHLTMLARARQRRAKAPRRLAGAIASVAGTFAIDAYTSARMTSDPQATRRGASVHGKATITVRSTGEEAQRRWREFAQAGGGLARLAPVEVLDEHPGRSTGFRSTDPDASGVAVFVDAPGGRGTEIHVDLEYGAPGGPVGRAVMKVSGDDPLQMVQDDLRRFKQLVETGEVVRSEGAPTGHSARLQPKQRPAQPLEPANA
jgi:uncharacterized membrane protein